MPEAAAARRPRPWWRREVWAFLELFALCGFVVLQPVLEVIGASPDFFIFHGVRGGGAVLLVAILALAPPVALWGLGALSGLAGRRVRRAVHAGSIGLLLVLLLVQLGKHVTSLRGAPLVVLALLAAAVIVVGYVRLAATGQLLRFAAVGPPVFALLFAFASPSSAVLFAVNATPGSGGEARVTGPNPPIVMIVFDEFPLLSLLDEEAEIDAARFPNFARLAGESTWYRNATTVSGWTPYAMPAMMTGHYPSKEVAPHYVQYRDNLFTLLGGVYQIEANESIAELCPPWECGERADQSRGGLPVALAESTTLLREINSPVDRERDPYAAFAEPTVAERLDAGAVAADLGPRFRFERVADNQPVRFQNFLAQLAAAEPFPSAGIGGWAEPASPAPTLHFLHLLLPHTPWTYLPSGMRYHNVPGLPVDGQWWSRLALQRHLLQLEYTDRLLGQTLRVLEETGRYDESLVIVTADHGVSLTPGTAGRELGDTDLGATELAWVPLFIKEPGQVEGVVDDRNWQHVDLLPTVADLAGVELPWQTDGVSATLAPRIETDKLYFNDLDDRRVLDGPAHFAQIRDAPGSVPPLPPAPLPHLVGAAVADFPVAEGDVRAEVDHAERFAEVDPGSGLVPALVHGTVSTEVAEGTALAVAVNGRIGAVVPVVAGAENTRRFAGLVEDEAWFVPGSNQLELFLVTDDGAALQRIWHS